MYKLKLLSVTEINFDHSVSLEIEFIVFEVAWLRTGNLIVAGEGGVESQNKERQPAESEGE